MGAVGRRDLIRIRPAPEEDEREAIEHAIAEASEEISEPPSTRSSRWWRRGVAEATESVTRD